MIDANAFYDNNPNSMWRKRPALQSMDAESEADDDMGETVESAQLSDEQCLLATGVVCGFDLRTKDWCK